MTRKLFAALVTASLAGALGLVAPLAAAGASHSRDYEPVLKPADFVRAITNPYLPFPVGRTLTYRGINSAVTLITGHNSDGAVPGEEESAPDWAALANGSPVIVLYMALRHLDDIANRLIAAGRAPEEPVAIVSKATTAAQRVVITTLGAAAHAAQEVESPAIIAIGEIARLHGKLAWYRG